MGGMAIGLIIGACIGVSFCSDPLALADCIKVHVPAAAAGGAVIGGFGNTLWDKFRGK